RDDQAADERVPGMQAGVDGGEDRPDRHRHRADDDEPELHLDRADPVQRPVGQVRRGHQRPCPSAPAYPTPWTVRMTSGPAFRRTARTCESTVRGPEPSRYPHTSASSSARVRTTPG